MFSSLIMTIHQVINVPCFIFFPGGRARRRPWPVRRLLPSGDEIRAHPGELLTTAHGFPNDAIEFSLSLLSFSLGFDAVATAFPLLSPFSPMMVEYSWHEVENCPMEERNERQGIYIGCRRVRGNLAG
jgi:hypothetical protein